MFVFYLFIDCRSLFTTPILWFTKPIRFLRDPRFYGKYRHRAPVEIKMKRFAFYFFILSVLLPSTRSLRALLLSSRSSAYGCVVRDLNAFLMLLSRLFWLGCFSSGSCYGSLVFTFITNGFKCCSFNIFCTRTFKYHHI